MRIIEKMKEQVSEKYYPKVDEIGILDDTQEYTIHLTRNRAKFSQVLKNYKSDAKVAYTTNITLMGEVDLYPVIQVNSKFAVVLLVVEKIEYGKINKENIISIYEEDPRLSY